MGSKGLIWEKERSGDVEGPTRDALYTENAANLILMRAYFCHGCARLYSEKHELWQGTGYDVYGIEDPGAPGTNPACVDESGIQRGGWKGKEARAITGCNCMEKLMEATLCFYHRQSLVQRMISQAKLIRRWRLTTFGKHICPMCQKEPGAEDPNSPPPPTSDQPLMWCCLLCGGMVKDPDSGDTATLIPPTEEKYQQWWVHEGKDYAPPGYQSATALTFSLPLWPKSTTPEGEDLDMG